MNRIFLAMMALTMVAIALGGCATNQSIPEPKDPIIKSDIPQSTEYTGYIFNHRLFICTTEDYGGRIETLCVQK